MSASVRTAFSSLKFPRPAPIPPSKDSRKTGSSGGGGLFPFSHKRVGSESNLVTRDAAGELTYDHFAFLKARVGASGAATENDTSQSRSAGSGAGTATSTGTRSGQVVNEAAVVKRGLVGLQRDTLRSWSWTKKVWLVLEERALHACPKEDAPPAYTIPLDQVTRLERIDARKCCFAISSNTTTWFLLFKDITALNEWFHMVRVRSPLLHISHPTSFQHNMHVTYDPAAGEITGLPEEWITTLASWGVQSPPSPPPPPPQLSDPAPPQPYTQSDPGISYFNYPADGSGASRSPTLVSSPPPPPPPPGAGLGPGPGMQSRRSLPMPPSPSSPRSLNATTYHQHQNQSQHHIEDPTTTTTNNKRNSNSRLKHTSAQTGSSSASSSAAVYSNAGNSHSSPNSSVPSPTSSTPKGQAPPPPPPPQAPSQAKAQASQALSYAQWQPQPQPQWQHQLQQQQHQPQRQPQQQHPAITRSRSATIDTVGARSKSSQEDEQHGYGYGYGYGSYKTAAEEKTGEKERPKSVVPSVGASIGAFRKSPQVFRDVEARNLTGSVQPSHLLPSSRDENCDIWKGEWTGGFGKRKVDIHIIRLSPLTLPSSTPALQTLILAEVKALHQLRHPNVVRIRGYAMDEQDRYGWGPLPGIVETWMPGGNVIEWLEFKRPVVGKIERLRVLTEAAAGLNYLHSFSREIIHGNFRGLHILLNEHNVACVSGYGINPVLSEMEFDPYAAASEISPAPRWASVEAFAIGRKALSAASDVWSFARTVLEVMTSRHPFEYITDDAEVIPFVLRNILPRRPPVFSTPALMGATTTAAAAASKSKQQDPSLWVFLERCWAEKPAERPTMAAVLVRMEEVLERARSSGDDEACVPAPKSLAG